jgi:hypothetical protein
MLNFRVAHRTPDQQARDEYASVEQALSGASSPDRCREIATTCTRRLLRGAHTLPIDVITDYLDLANRARHKMTELEAK